MKHLFLEGPIQTGKSTLIRQALEAYSGPLYGFTSQRLLEVAVEETSQAEGDVCGTSLSQESVCEALHIRKSFAETSCVRNSAIETSYVRNDAVGTSCVRNDAVGTSNANTPASPRTLAFRMAPASAPLTSPISDIIPDWPNTSESECIAHGVFKGFTPDGVLKYPQVFQQLGLRYLQEAAHADSKGLILLDEIGGHELTDPAYMNALCELITGDVPCIGVIKHPENTRHMDPSLMELNAQLHEFIESHDGEILYYDRHAENAKTVEIAIASFIDNL